MTPVEKIITKPKATIKINDPIVSAIKIMLKRDLSTCPVVDMNGVFLGQLTDASLIKALILIQSGIQIKTVFELRRYFLKPQTVKITSSIYEIAKKLFSSPSQRVFVIDSGNKLIGVVSPKSLLEFLTNEFKILKGDDVNLTNKSSKIFLQHLKNKL